MVNMVDLKKALFEGGVVGAGGAGFPTHAKLSDQAETIILNCAECEPLIKVDRQLMIEHVKSACRYADAGGCPWSKGRNCCS